MPEEQLNEEVAPEKPEKNEKNKIIKIMLNQEVLKME